MSRETCPTCGIPWPNFCPKDGTKLEGPWTCPNAEAEAAVETEPDTLEGRPAVRRTASDDPDATVLETPAVPRSAARDWIADRARRAGPADPDDQKTMLDVEAVSPPPATEDPRPPATRPAKRKKSLSAGSLGRIADRVKKEVAKGRKPVERGATQHAEEAVPPEEAKAAKKGARRKRRGSDEFSETQWFMKGLEMDADLLETVDEEEYKRDESISENKRQKYTLRDDDED